MKYKKFKDIISTLERISNRESTTYDLKIDLFNFTEDYHRVISMLLIEIYGKEGQDWVSWFCYENDFGTGKLTATLHDKPIAYDIKSLWKMLEKDYKNKKDGKKDRI